MPPPTTQRVFSQAGAVGKGLFKSAWGSLDAVLDGGLSARFNRSHARRREKRDLGPSFHAWNIALYGMHLCLLWWWLDRINDDMLKKMKEQGVSGDNLAPLKRMPASRLKFVEDHEVKPAGESPPGPLAGVAQLSVGAAALAALRRGVDSMRHRALGLVPEQENAAGQDSTGNVAAVPTSTPQEAAAAASAIPPQRAE